MVNKKLHWVAVIFLILAIFIFIYGLSNYLSQRDPNQFSELQDQTIDQNSVFKTEIQDYYREIGVFENTRSNKTLDVAIVTSKNNFNFATILDTSATISKGKQYIFQKQSSYSGISSNDIREQVQNIYKSKQDLPVLYLVGTDNQLAESAIIGTVLITSILMTVSLFSYLYSRETKIIIINENNSIKQSGN